MTDTLTFNVVNSNNNKTTTSKFTILIENEDIVNSKFINSIIDAKNNNITVEQMKILQSVAARDGDKGVLEAKDLKGTDKLKLANFNGYSEYYDIKLIDNGKFFEVTIKKTPWYTENPTLGTLKKDFGVRDNVFVKKGEIPYGNADAVNEAISKNGIRTNGKNNIYDSVKFNPGQKINIPVNEITIQDSPKGALGRFTNQIYLQ